MFQIKMNNIILDELRSFAKMAKKEKESEPEAIKITPFYAILMICGTSYAMAIIIFIFEVLHFIVTKKRAPF